MDYIKIDSDQWDDVNKVWRVLEYFRRDSSTAVSLVLENAYTKEVVERVVPFHQIVELEAKDW